MPRKNRIIPELTPQDVARFWARVDRSPGQGPNGDCWISWHHRYGTIWISGQRYGRHRVAFFIATGINPGRLDVCHKCDEPQCCNPDHLFLGTHADNRRDSAVKGRSAKKLKAEQVQQIRILLRHGGTRRKLAEKFGVSKGAIDHIAHDLHWKHLPKP